MQTFLDIRIQVDPHSLNVNGIVEEVTKKIKEIHSASIDEILKTYFNEKELSSRVTEVVRDLLRFEINPEDRTGRSNYYAGKVTEFLDAKIGDYLATLKEEDFKNMILKRMISKLEK